MDRATVYTQEQARSVDFLFAQRATMIGLGKLAQAAFGSNTVVRGLAVTPNSPAALNVLVGIGEIYTMAQVDATPWGALAADTTDTIVKQGLNMAAQTISTPAPSTSGYSINYLIEAQYQDQDNVAVVLPYYNSANPSQPLNGQGGGGAAQATERQGVCVIQAKAGIAAATGTQTTPSVDSGWTALAVVTVANGQATVTSGNISVSAGVPQLTSLLQMMQTGSTRYAIDTSTTANQITISLTPPLTSYTDGQPLCFQAANNNTGPCNINAGPGNIALNGTAGAFQGSEIVAGKFYEAVYRANLGTAVVVGQSGGAQQIYPAAASEHAVQAAQVQSGGFTTLTSVAGTNAITATLIPAPTTIPVGARFRFQPANINTGVTTLQINSFAAHAISKFGNALQGGELNPTFYYEVVFDGTNYQLQNVAIPYFMTGAANSATEVDAMPSGTGVGSSFRAWGANSQINCEYVELAQTATDMRLTAGAVGSASYVPMTFYAGGSERMRVDSLGNFCFAKTTTAFGTPGVNLLPAGNVASVCSHGGVPLSLNVVSASGGEVMATFNYNSANVGSIQITSSATSYLTSSDYRLKENVVPLTGALERVMKWPVKQFNFKSAPDVPVDGFIAHELAEHEPNAVMGEKDATRDVENVVLNSSGLIEAEGVSKEAFEAAQEHFSKGATWHALVSVPVYQGVDHSKLVPRLAAAVQELQAQIDALRARLNG